MKKNWRKHTPKISRSTHVQTVVADFIVVTHLDWFQFLATAALAKAGLCTLT